MKIPFPYDKASGFTIKLAPGFALL